MGSGEKVWPNIGWRLPAWTGSWEVGFKPITVRTKFSQVLAETSPAGVYRREHIGILEKFAGKRIAGFCERIFARWSVPVGNVGIPTRLGGKQLQFIANWGIQIVVIFCRDGENLSHCGKSKKFDFYFCRRQTMVMGTIISHAARCGRLEPIGGQHISCRCVP